MGRAVREEKGSQEKEKDRKGRKGAKRSGKGKSRLAGCGAIWSHERSKKSRSCRAKQISKSKYEKHLRFGALLDYGTSKKKHAVGALLEVELLKSTRRCGAKHILKSTCCKHCRFGTLLSVEMLKKWTSLWSEAHAKVKIYVIKSKKYKTHQSRTTFGSSAVEKMHAAVARSTF